MRLIEEISSNINQIFDESNSFEYNKDFELAKKFLTNRNFEALQELIQAIITKEEGKKKKDRLITFYLLIAVKGLIDSYIIMINNDD